MEGKFYITTTIPYVNAPPHIGFALEALEADVIARYHRSLGEEVIFSTGTDEYGAKIYERALQEKKDPQAYVDEYVAKFEDLKSALGLSYTNFVRTTSAHHKKAAQKFWQLCDQSGDIEKKLYKIKYCVGCELEKTDSELQDGHCPLHPNRELEIREEENYFFKFSKYGERLLAFYEKNPDFVIPNFRFNEIKRFIEKGLNDFSISRLKEKMPWGVPVPGDEKHVMYVWFDALVNYVSTLGWPDESKTFSEFWPGMQIAGKDQIRQQAAMWQAMLMSAGIPNSKQILIHGFINIGGEKMSKSLGNVVDPLALASKYGTDAVRYFLARHIHPFDDSDFSIEEFEEAYNANLANGLGNFAARIVALGEGQGKIPLKERRLSDTVAQKIESGKAELTERFAEFKLNEAIDAIWQLIRFGDGYVNEKKPWKKAGEKDTQAVYELAEILSSVANMLAPFLPETAKKIAESIDTDHPDDVFGPVMRFKKLTPLFPRLD